MGLDEGRRELVHHHAAVLTVGDLAHQSRHRGGAQHLPAQAQRLGTGLHLSHQFRVGALGLDQGRDAGHRAAGAARHQPVRHQRLGPTQGAAIVVLDAVLLHQQPAVTAVPQRLDQGVQGVRVVGQMHLRQGEPPHALQGIAAEQGREVLLPGRDLQLQIRDRGGGGHRMAPERAEPLHVALKCRITGKALQGAEDVLAAHLLEPPEQGAGVIEHDPWITALADQLRQDVRQAPVAVGERFGVVVIHPVRVIEHELQVGDQFPVGPCRNHRLVHVQRAGEGRSDPLLRGHGLRRRAAPEPHQGLDLGFPPADRRQAAWRHPVVHLGSTLLGAARFMPSAAGAELSLQPSPGLQRWWPSRPKARPAGCRRQRRRPEKRSGGPFVAWGGP